jgi:hypothetical protein
MAGGEKSERFWLLLLPSWGLAVALLLGYCYDFGFPPMTPNSLISLLYLGLVLALIVVPFASRIKIGKIIELERELSKTRGEIETFKSETRQLFAAVTSVVGMAKAQSIVNIGVPASEDEIESPPAEQEERPRLAVELKILNTLWNRQVNRFPSLNKRWTFRINEVAPEFLQFREAANRLIGEGLVGETGKGQLYLTCEGLQYCKVHYETFPPDMWFEPMDLDQDKLKQILDKLS